VSAMDHDFRPDVAPMVAAAVRRFDLPPGPARGLVAGDGGIDWAGLRMGTRYRVFRELRAAAGRLMPGQRVHFLGYERDGRHLTLHFEGGGPLPLRFDDEAAPRPGILRWLTDPAAYMRPITFDFSRRSRRLHAARAVLLHLRSTHQGKALP